MQPQPMGPNPNSTTYPQGYPQTPGYPAQPGYPQTSMPPGQSNNYPATPYPGTGGYNMPAQVIPPFPLTVPIPVAQNIFAKPQTPQERVLFLSQYDFMVLVDKSGSMKLQNRWSTLNEYIGFIAQDVAKYDKNGMDVCFFDDVTHWSKNVESASKVVNLFQKYNPEGGTATHLALEEAFHKHFHRKKDKASRNEVQKTIILCFTDGEPNDQSAVSKKIISAANKLDSSLMFEYTNTKGKTVKKTLELGVRFFQIGTDEKAKHFLHQLDNHLTKVMKKKNMAKIDIVDTGNLEEVTDSNKIAEALVNAIFD